MESNKYIKRIKDTFNQNFPNKKAPTRTKSPLEPGYHPELDTSEFLRGDDVKMHQSLIGAM